MKLFPAPLTSTAQDLFAQIDRFSPYFSYIQIDIADGKFVPNTTVQIEEIQNYLNNLQDKNRYQRSQFDIHLMVNDYEAEIKKMSEITPYLPIQRVFIHFGVLRDYGKLVEKYREYSLGIVLNPEDEVQKLTREIDLETVPNIQIMTVKPGFQGSPFLPKALNKIDQLRKLSYGGKIFIDGGVNDTTLPDIACREYKPDYLGVGSFFSKADDIEKNITTLQEMIK